MKAISIALACIDLAPVFFLALGLFFLAQLVDRLDPRCRRLALAGLGLVTIAGLARSVSNLALAVSGRELPVLSAALYVFGGPGFTLMAAALLRARGTGLGQRATRDPWIAPALLSWGFLIVAFYLNRTGTTSGWRHALLLLALAGFTATALAAASLGWRRHLHMAAGLFASSIGGTAVIVLLRAFPSQPLWMQALEVLLSVASQAAFAFAAWRVAAEYQARVGPIAATP